MNRLFIEILQSTPSEEEIEFFEDGSWKPKVEKEKNGKSNGSSYSSQASGSSRNGTSAPVIQMIGGMDGCWKTTSRFMCQNICHLWNRGSMVLFFAFYALQILR